MTLSRKVKAIFITIIMLILIFGIMGESLGDVATAAEAAENATDVTMLQLIFGYWWVPFLLLILGLILGQTGGIRAIRRRFSRRRR